MQLGRVVGQVVATRKDDALEGKTLLLIQPLDKQGRDRGRTLVGVDAVGAGAGETIYWVPRPGSLPGLASPSCRADGMRHRRHRRLGNHRLIPEAVVQPPC